MAKQGFWLSISFGKKTEKTESIELNRSHNWLPSLICLVVLIKCPAMLRFNFHFNACSWISTSLPLLSFPSLALGVKIDLLSAKLSHPPDCVQTSRVNPRVKYYCSPSEHFQLTWNLQSWQSWPHPPACVRATVQTFARFHPIINDSKSKILSIHCQN